MYIRTASEDSSASSSPTTQLISDSDERVADRLMGAPELTGDALRAVRHRGSHLQIIAVGRLRARPRSCRSGWRPHGRRCAARGDRRVHVHRAGRRRAEGPDRSTGRGAPRPRGARPARTACSSGRSTPTASGCCRRTSRATRPTTSSTTTSSRRSSPARPTGSSCASSTTATGSSARSTAFLRAVDVVENELLDPHDDARAVPLGAGRRTSTCSTATGS